MKRFKFNKPLVTSDEIPNTTQDVLWVQLNDNKKITAIKELDRTDGQWKEFTSIGGGSGEEVAEVTLNSSTFAPTDWPEEWDEFETTYSGYLPWKAEVDTDVYVYGSFVQATIDNPIQTLHLPSPTSLLGPSIIYKRVYTDNAWPATWTLVE